MKTSIGLAVGLGLSLAIASSVQLSPGAHPAPSASLLTSDNVRSEFDLYEALKSNDAASVKRLLKQHIDLNHLYQPPLLDVRATSYHAAPFLYWALLFGCQNDIHTALIESGANVNFRFREPEDVTLLMQAAYQFPAASVRFLLDHGARINDRTRSGRTALMFAVTDGNPALGERSGADAAENASLLVSRGASVGVRDSSGKTPAMVAALNYRGSAASLTVLLAYRAKANEADAAGVTPLMCASQPGNLKAVKLLLQHGASVKACDREGQTALMHALYPHCSKVNLSGVMEALYHAGVEINAQNQRGETALDYATEWEERLGSIVPLLERLHAVHGKNPHSRMPPDCLKATTLWPSL